MASVFRLKLLNYVQQTTGAPRFSLVADLLYGAFTAARIDGELDVDADTLRKLYIRQSTFKSPS
jgi:hypothetical protein